MGQFGHVRGHGACKGCAGMGYTCMRIFPLGPTVDVFWSHDTIDVCVRVGLEVYVTAGTGAMVGARRGATKSMRDVPNVRGEPRVYSGFGAFHSSCRVRGVPNWRHVH